MLNNVIEDNLKKKSILKFKIFERNWNAKETECLGLKDRKTETISLKSKQLQVT